MQRPAAPASEQFIKAYFRRNFSFFSTRRKRLCAPNPPACRARLLSGRGSPVPAAPLWPCLAPGLPGAPRDVLAASPLPPDEAGQGPPVLPVSGAGAARYGRPQGVPASAPGRSGGRQVGRSPRASESSRGQEPLVCPWVVAAMPVRKPPVKRRSTDSGVEPDRGALSQEKKAQRTALFLRDFEQQGRAGARGPGPDPPGPGGQSSEPQQRPPRAPPLCEGPPWRRGRGPGAAEGPRGLGAFPRCRPEAFVVSGCSSVVSVPVLSLCAACGAATLLLRRWARG